jgi:hypothetical protein
VQLRCGGQSHTPCSQLPVSSSPKPPGFILQGGHGHLVAALEARHPRAVVRSRCGFRRPPHPTPPQVSCEWLCARAAARGAPVLVGLVRVLVHSPGELRGRGRPRPRTPTRGGGGMTCAKHTVGARGSARQAPPKGTARLELATSAERPMAQLENHTTELDT